MKKIEYTIIIPHHNIPHLLERCLASIPYRNDLEIIVVDDNSDDKLVDFSNFPGANRNDVKLIFDKKGGGGGYARNLALKIAQGKKILFIDADDYFNYCINDILSHYINDDSDIVFFKANSIYTDTYLPADRHHLINEWNDLYRKNQNKGELCLRYMFGGPVCKLIKRQLIEDNNIWFDETRIHNDTHFSYLIGFFAKKIKVDPHAIYMITEREGSTCRIKSVENSMIRIEVFGKKALFLKDHNIPIVEKLHIKQLIWFQKENKEAYHEAFVKLIDLGFTEKQLRKEMFKQKVWNFLYDVKHLWG